MSAATARVPVRSGATRRRIPRYPIAVPVDVTVLRSGIPATIPGRSLDVGEGGLAAILAGELHPGDSVGLEFRLPDLDVQLRAKAVVRHQARLRFGVEFLGIPPEQLELIRHWARRTAAAQPESQPAETYRLEHSPEVESLSQPRQSVRLRQLLGLALALIVVAVGMLSWQWYRAWEELESHVPRKPAAANPMRARVPAGVMEQLLIHKVEPVYPEAARQANVQGVVVLNAVIAPDGTVVDVRRVSGPAALAPAAMDAVKWWRFQPYRVNGQPVEAETTIAVEFHAD
jgi:TonB family protein